jgi:hypothetical protein
MNTFAVVKSTGKRKHADECEDRTHKKYSKGHFFCIDCGNDVFVRRGQKKVWHFAHYCEEAAKKCPHANGGETKEHYDAKHFIANNIGRCEFVVEKCPVCTRRRIFVGKHQGKHQQIHKCQAEVEMRIPGTHRVADVAAISRETGMIVAAIEVFHTHETDSDKRKECAALGIPVLEVTTKEVGRFMPQGGGRIRMSTTRIPLVKCASCTMRECAMKELRTVIDYERWYNDSYQSFHVRKPCVVVCKKEVPRYVSKRKPEYAQEEYLAELEYARCYDKMWYEHEARVNARKRYEMSTMAHTGMYHTKHTHILMIKRA